MPKYKRASRLRRNVATTPHPPEAGGLKRSLWGLTERHAAELLSQQEQALQGAQGDAEAAHLALEQEIDRLRKRVDLLRQSTDILTQRLVKNRAAAGAATRMVEHQMAKLERENAAAASDLKFETVRASAELQLERQAFRDFLGDLYRVLEGRGALPPELEPKVPTPPEGQLPDRPDWRPLLIGKIVGRTVKTAGGVLLAQAGEVVSADTVAAAEENGLLPDLFLAIRIP